jgi:integrase
MRNRRGDGDGTDHGVSGGGTPVQIRVAKWGGEWKVIFGQGSGKSRRRVVACESEREAKDVAAGLAAQVEAGGLQKPEPGQGPGRVDELMDRWLDMKAVSKVRASTLTTYGYQATAIRAGLGGVPLLAVTSLAVDRYSKRRLDAGRSPATVADERAVIRMAFGWAATQGWWRGDARHLGAGLDLEVTTEKKWLEVDQVPPFLTAIKDPGMHVLGALGVYAGLRLGEALHLPWRHVDLRRACIHIRPVSLPGGLEWRPKTRAGIRTIDIPPDLVEILRVHRATSGADLCPDAWVTATHSGERRKSSRHVLTAIGRACQKAGLPRVTYHELRHTWVTMLHDAGVPLAVIAAMAGHESEVVTRQVYRHLTDHARREAAGRLQGFLRGADCPARDPARLQDFAGGANAATH